MVGLKVGNVAAKGCGWLEVKEVATLVKIKEMMQAAREQQSKEMALKMLKKNASVEKVVYCTRLPFEEVERLKRRLNNCERSSQ